MHDDDLVTEDQVKALAEERDITGDDEQAQAERLFKEHLPSAVLTIISLARNAASERVRMSAAQYIVERNLGKITDRTIAEEQDELRQLVQELTATT